MIRPYRRRTSLKGIEMRIRKIAVLGGFAVVAALTSAPLASADNLTSTLDSEIASLNSIFESEAAIAGDSADVVTGGTGVLDTIPLADAPDAAPLTTLDYEMYGPFANLLIGNLDAAPGAQDVSNGALVEFDDAYNALVYLVIGDQAEIPSTDLIGVADQALAAGGTLTDAGLFGSFLDSGLSDLLAGIYSVPL